MSNGTPKLGVKLSAQDAKTYVDTLNKKVLQRWQERVTDGLFMKKFLDGTLPLSSIKLFFKNWGNFTVEINTLVVGLLSQAYRFLETSPRSHGAIGNENRRRVHSPQAAGSCNGHAANRRSARLDER